jgi:dienelactone hydrolase
LFRRIERMVDLAHDESGMTRALEGLQLAAGAKANVEIDVHEGAGHAFDNPHADWHDRDAAARAWDRTAAFLAAHLAASS